jgi:hypothetical protein
VEQPLRKTGWPGLRAAARVRSSPCPSRYHCMRREAEIVDALVDLLIQITQKIARKAKKRVEKEFLAAGAVLVRGKTGILYALFAHSPARARAAKSCAVLIRGFCRG